MSINDVYARIRRMNISENKLVNKGLKSNDDYLTTMQRLNMPTSACTLWVESHWKFRV